MTKPQKYSLAGFLFGALGLYVLAALSLISQVFELIFVPLFTPGRTMSALFVGSEGSNLDVLLLSVFNGLFYALIFYVVGCLLARSKKDELTA